MDFSQMNLAVFRAINDLAGYSPVLNTVVVAVAQQFAYGLALALLVYWFTRTRQNRAMVLSAVLSFGVAEGLGLLTGHFISHPQPFATLPYVNQLIPHQIDNSFPSDHSLLFFSVCVSFWLVRKKEGWLWLVIACCVAVSRVWVGVHYPVDIAVGALLGSVAAVIVHKVVPKLSAITALLAWYERMEARIWPVKKKGQALLKEE